MDDGLEAVSLEAHFLLAGLPVLADSAGRLEDRPKRIQAQIFPYRPTVDVDACLSELAKTGHVARYVVRGVRYLQVVNWEKDQRPHVKEADSVIPPPADYTGPRQGSELAGNSPGTRRGESAGIMGVGSGVLDSGSGIRDSEVPPASRPAPEQRDLLPEEKPAKAKKPKAVKPTDPRHRPLLEQLVAQGWELGGSRGAGAVTDLLARAGETVTPDEAPQEVLRRAGHALQKHRTMPEPFPRVAELWELVTHWKHFAEPFRAPAGRGPAPPSDFEAPFVPPKFSWLEDPK